MTDGLVEFLIARLDEDERAARQALTDRENDRGQGVRIMDGKLAIMPSAMSNGLAMHFARHDPARVLADIESKRRIVEKYRALVEDFEHADETVVEHTRRVALEEVLEILAAPFSGEPGYKESWAV